MQPVDSSNIHSVGYDPETRHLHVKFKSGGAVYRYEGVAPEAHAQFVAADSKGKHFKANILGKFKHAKLA